MTAVIFPSIQNTVGICR